MVSDPNVPNVPLTGPEWAEVERWAAEQLQRTYEQLAGDLPPNQTDHLRGRASVFRQMLDFKRVHAAFVKPHN